MTASAAGGLVPSFIDHLQHQAVLMSSFRNSLAAMDCDSADGCGSREGTFLGSRQHRASLGNGRSRLKVQSPPTPRRYRSVGRSNEEPVLSNSIGEIRRARGAVRLPGLTRSPPFPLSQASRTSGSLHQSVWPSVLGCCRWGQHQSPPSSGGTPASG